MHIPDKIISGGQTGTDQAALSAALRLKIKCGGWCPPGRLCENGRIPETLPLIETPAERSNLAPDIPRSQRTEWNVRDADATLVLKPLNLNDNKGIKWALECIIIYKKTCLILDPFEDGSACKLEHWLSTNRIKILNVAGPSERSCPGIGSKSYDLLFNIFQQPG